MARLALALAVAALGAAAVPSPGLYVAMGLGLAALGIGASEFGRRELPGRVRITAAAAITIGCIGFLLGTLRVLLVLSAIDHVDGMLG